MLEEWEGQGVQAVAIPMSEVGGRVCTNRPSRDICLNVVMWNAVTVARCETSTPTRLESYVWPR